MPSFWDEFEPVETVEPPVEAFDWSDFELVSEEPAQQPQFPALPARATLADVLQQPAPMVSPWEGGVVRSVFPGALQPEELRPALRLIGGEIVGGEPGDTHPDIIDRERCSRLAY